MQEGPVEIIKPALVKNKPDVKSFLKINPLQDLSFTGMEGRKYFTPIVNPRYNNESHNVAPVLKFVSKEYPLEYKKKVIALIETYAKLRKVGCPVPATTRYFEKDGKVFLLMTDMTENGIYKLWGRNDNITKQYIDDLKSMGLTDEDLQRIRQLGYAIADKAQEANIDITMNNYCIRKNVKTGKIDLCLLDVYPQINNDSYGHKSIYNRSFVDDFITIVADALKLNFKDT